MLDREALRHYRRRLAELDDALDAAAVRGDANRMAQRSAERDALITNKEIIETIYANFARGDVPAVLGAMADDIEWVEAYGFPLAGTYVGPQNVLEGVFMRRGEIGDEYSVAPDQFVAEGDTVVTLGNYTWKHNSSGEPASVKMAHVWTIGDGKVIAFQQHVDTIRVRELS